MESTNLVIGDPILQNYCTNKKAIILHNSSSIRNNIKKILVQTGICHNNIDQASTYKEGELLLEKTKHQLVIANTKLPDNEGLQLINPHLKLVPNRLDGSFLLIADDDITDQQIIVINSETDALLAAPFTIKGLIETLLNCLSKKITPTKYQAMLNEGKQHFFLDDFDSATQSFLKATALDANAPDAYFYLGEIARKKNDLPMAIFYWEKGLENNSIHYRILNSLLQAKLESRNYSEAYKYGVILLDNFPLAPENISIYMKLSIANRKYDDLERYYQFFQLVKNPSQNLAFHMAAGLAICGQHFIGDGNDYNKGLDAFQKSVSLAQGKIEIIRSVISALMKNKLFKEAQEIISLCSNETDDQNKINHYQILELEIMHSLSHPPQNIVNFARSLLGKNIKEQIVFDILLKNVQKTDARIVFIEDVIHEAINLFSEQKEQYQMILANLKKERSKNPN